MDVTGLFILLQTDIEEKRDAIGRWLRSSAYTPPHLQEHWQLSSSEDQVTLSFVSEWYITVYKNFRTRTEKMKKKKEFLLIKHFNRILLTSSICCLLPGAPNQNWTDQKIVSLRQHVCKFRPHLLSTFRSTYSCKQFKLSPF